MSIIAPYLVLCEKNWFARVTSPWSRAAKEGNAPSTRQLHGTTFGVPTRFPKFQSIEPLCRGRCFSHEELTQLLLRDCMVAAQ